MLITIHFQTETKFTLFVHFICILSSLKMIENSHCCLPHILFNALKLWFYLCFSCRWALDVQIYVDCNLLLWAQDLFTGCLTNIVTRNLELRILHSLTVSWKIHNWTFLNISVVFSIVVFQSWRLQFQSWVSLQFLPLKYLICSEFWIRKIFGIISVWTITLKVFISL
jgi:hypothetical protein